MPPLPTSTDTEALALVESLHRRSSDIRDVQIPRLNACTGPPLVHQRLAAELREDLDIVARQIETLEMYAEDAPRRAEREVLAQLVDEFKKSITQMRKDMRAALLRSKRVVDARSQSSFRAELFGSAAQRDSRSVEDKASDDALMRTTNNVTDTLRRSVGTMQAELEKSVLSHQLLEQSTSSLRGASKAHDTLSQAADTARLLTTALSRTDALDRALILASLLFFVLVVLFVIQQRIMSRAVGIAFWWTRFVPGFRSGPGPAMNVEVGYDLEKAGRARAGTVSATASSTEISEKVASTVLSAAASALSAVAAAASAKVSSSSQTLSSSQVAVGSISSLHAEISSDSSSLSWDILSRDSNSTAKEFETPTSLSSSLLSSSASSSSSTLFSSSVSEARVRHSDEL